MKGNYQSDRHKFINIMKLIKKPLTHDDMKWLDGDSPKNKTVARRPPKEC